MPDLRAFIETVKEFGELRLVEGANWQWEMSALTYSVAKSPSPPAILFDKVPGYRSGFRVLMMPFSTQKRLALVWQQPSNATGLDVVKAIRDRMSERFQRLSPQEVIDGPVLENVKVGSDVDLLSFPTPQFQPEDGGRYIGTGNSVITKDPDEGWVNLGAYRVQVHDRLLRR